MTRFFFSSLVCSLAFAGCTSNGPTSMTDTGGAPVDTGASRVDTGVPPTDTGIAPADTGMPGNDANMTSCAGVECTNWAAAVSAASSLNGAAGGSPDVALQNCVIQLHQSDCCGARRAYGFNHAARMQLCMAEAACDMQYPTPAGCTSTTITTDTAETTTDATRVRLRVVNPTPCMFGTCYTCQTFVCNTAACMNAPTIMPRQCG